MKRLIPYSVVTLFVVSGCASRSSYHVPSRGHFFVVQEPGGMHCLSVVDTHSIEGYEEVFQRAIPLAMGLPPKTMPDFEFVEIVDGRAVKKYALYREGEILSAGRWTRVDGDWHNRWRIMFDPAQAAEFLMKGDQSLQRTGADARRGP